MFSRRLTKSVFNIEAYMQDDNEDSNSGINIFFKNIESQKPDYADDSDPVYRPSPPYQQEQTVY